MKKLFLTAFLGLLLAGCAAQEKTNDFSDTLLTPKPTEAAVETVTLKPTEAAAAEVTPDSSKSSADGVTPKPTELVPLKETVEYHSVFVGDSVKLCATEGEGFLADLDGDGTEEQMYLNAQGLFLNGFLVLKKEEIVTSAQEYQIWLLDFDTTDSMYELLTPYGGYCLYYYVDGELHAIRNTHSMLQSGEKQIWNFERIDEHTISFHDWHFVFDSYELDVWYRLNETHELAVVPREYMLETPHLFAYLDTENGLKLYQNRDLQGGYAEVTGVRLFHLTKSDGVNWVYLESPYQESGWIYCETTENGEIINKEVSASAFVGFNPLP